jgi:hypothetical protein
VFLVPTPWTVLIHLRSTGQPWHGASCYVFARTICSSHAARDGGQERGRDGKAATDSGASRSTEERGTVADQHSYLDSQLGSLQRRRTEKDRRDDPPGGGAGKHGARDGVFGES